MFYHNFILIFRNFKRFRSTFFINLVGLSAGLTCLILIYLWVNDELIKDQFHVLDERLYQVMESQEHTGNIRVTDSTPWLLAEALTEELPEVAYAVVATPTFWYNNQTLSVGNNGVKGNAKFAGKNFFKIFSYELLQGNEDQVLADKSAIVISESMAIKLFNTTENVVGKTVEYQHEKTFTVSGIFKDVGRNSSEYFDFLLSYKVLLDARPGMADWGNAGPNTFVVLHETAKAGDFEKKIANFIHTKHISTHRTLFLQKYSDNYLYGNYINGVQSGGRIEYVRMFSVIAVFILIIACINFMNLSTAKASARIREVGIKKAIGARRRTLVAQYLAESMVMTALSLAIAILATDLLLPQFNTITGKDLTLEFDGRLPVILAAIVAFTGLLSGSYPALYLSGFNPATVLKGKLNTSLGELWARKGLVVFQFTMSVILIVSVLVIYKQIRFVQDKHLGYDKENIIYFPIEGTVRTNLETFLSELKNVPGVVGASSMMQSMVGGGNTTSIEWDGKDPEHKIPFAYRPVHFGMLELLDLQVVEGRLFSPEFGTDTSAVIFNEAGIEAMGMVDPLGREVSLGPDIKLKIIGVVANFHFESLKSEVGPMFFLLKPQYTELIAAKIARGQEVSTLETLETFYKQHNTGFAFDYRFLDEDYQAQYGAEKRVSTLSKYFAGIAILISCLGLFGLAAFTAERRRKEIGIRKVLGASEFGIVYLLSEDFSKLVLLAILLALPFSYVLTRQWLDNFVYKIALEWWYFLAAGMIALCIAGLTVAAQAIRASRVNPTQCLREV